MKAIPFETRKVLLVGDPPAVYKFRDEIEALGYEVDHVRCDHSPAKVLAAITPGLTFCVAMNLRGQGAAVKEACRRVGATFVSVPPSWTAARLPLVQAGVMVDPGRPLAHRPFGAALATKALADQVLEKLDETLAKVPVVLGRPMDVPPDKPKEPAPPAPPKVVGIKLRTPPPEPPAPEPTPEPVVQPEPTPEPKEANWDVRTMGPPPGAREKALDNRKAVSDEKAAMVRRLFEAGPDLDPIEVNAQVAAKFGGSGLTSQRLYEIRREVRGGLGLNPNYSQRPRRHRSPEAQPAPVLAPAEGGLPKSVLDAQARLVEALRAAGGVKEYSLLVVGDQAEVSFEIEVRATAKGKASL